MRLTIIRRNAIVARLQVHRLAFELSRVTDSALVQEYCRVHRCNVTIRENVEGNACFAFSGEPKLFTHASEMVAHAYADSFDLGCTPRGM
jgi:hypothetical protein